MPERDDTRRRYRRPRSDERSGRRRHPEWARRERAGDLAWIQGNLHVFWPAAQDGYEQAGRGAIVVDTTTQPEEETGHPFGYLPQQMLEQYEGEDILRMIVEYDPPWEFVTVLIKTEERTSTYRVGVPAAADE